MQLRTLLYVALGGDAAGVKEQLLARGWELMQASDLATACVFSRASISLLRCATQDSFRWRATATGGGCKILPQWIRPFSNSLRSRHVTGDHDE